MTIVKYIYNKYYKGDSMNKLNNILQSLSFKKINISEKESKSVNQEIKTDVTLGLSFKPRYMPYQESLPNYEKGLNTFIQKQEISNITKIAVSTDNNEPTAEYSETAKLKPTEYSEYSDLIKLKSTDSNEAATVQETVNKEIQEIMDFGSSTIIGSNNSVSTDVNSIYAALQRYNNGMIYNDAQSEFLNIINDGLKASGINPNSKNAKLYIEALIYKIENNSADISSLAKSGNVLHSNALYALDSNNDNSIMEELKELALSDEVKKITNRYITADMIKTEFDQNNNNLIDINELQKAADNGNDFAKLFMDNNGNIDRKLFLALGLKQEDYSGNGLIIEYFIIKFDKNNDGKITQEDINIIKNSDEYKRYSLTNILK